MLQNLIAQAQSKPEELERILAELEAAKQKLDHLMEAKQAWEAQTALDVAKDKSYSNDTMRKAEIARRLKENQQVQELEKEIAATKTEAAALEVKAERVKWELRNTQALIQLAAAAIQAGNQEVLQMLMAKQEKATEEKQEAKGNGLTEMTVKILGAMPGKKEGVVKALVQDKDGNKFEVYGNGQNNVAQRLAKAINETVRVKAKKLSHGWFVVEVA